MEKTYKKIEKQKYSKEEKRELWDIATGLNKIDRLEQSDDFYSLIEEEIEGTIELSEMKEKLENKYSNSSQKANNSQKMADLVAIRMNEKLQESGFSFSVAYFKSIHAYIFQDELVIKELLSDEKYLGEFRDYNITKNELVLNGESVQYGNAPDLKKLLTYDFEEESERKYKGKANDIVVRQISRFTSSIWQAHPFVEGNTRTVALFIEKYLKSKSFDITTSIFKDHSIFFRDALVVSNALEEHKCLQQFFRKCLFEPKLKLGTIKAKSEDNEEFCAEEV